MNIIEKLILLFLDLRNELLCFLHLHIWVYEPYDDSVRRFCSWCKHCQLWISEREGFSGHWINLDQKR
jgi:hypothetical protein